MSDTLHFLLALKQAAEDYQNQTPRTFRVLGFLGYRSIGSRTLIEALAHLDINEPDDSLVSAVKAIIAYIHRVGTSDNTTRGIWVKELQPCLEKFAADPLTDVSDTNKAELTTLELNKFPCSTQIVKQRGLLFNVLGTEKKLSQHFSLHTDSGITNANTNMIYALQDYVDSRQDGATPGAARILHAAFAHDKKIPGKVFQFAKNADDQAGSNRYSGHTLLKMLDKIDLDELLMFLKQLKSGHPSINDVMPSLLYKIADRKQAQEALAEPPLPTIEFPSTRYAREEKLNKLTQTSIDCLKEIKRVAPHFYFERIHNTFYAIVTGDAKHVFEAGTKSNAEIAYAIDAQPLWKQELMNESSSIRIREIVLTAPALEIRGILELKNKKTNRN